MEQYLICEKRGNRPRIHVKICECRCPDAGSCPGFKAYNKNRNAGESIVTKPQVQEPAAQETSALAAP